MFLVLFRAKREENFEDIYAPHVRKNENLKTIFSNFYKFEKPQNPSCMIWKSILKNLKNLNLEVAGGDLKGGGFSFNRVVGGLCENLPEEEFRVNFGIFFLRF